MRKASDRACLTRRNGQVDHVDSPRAYESPRIDEIRPQSRPAPPNPPEKPVNSPNLPQNSYRYRPAQAFSRRHIAEQQ